MTTVFYCPTLFLFVKMEFVKNGLSDFLYLIFLILFYSFFRGGGCFDKFFNFIWTIILTSESEKIENFFLKLGRFKTNLFYFSVHGQKLCKTFQK